MSTFPNHWHEKPPFLVDEGLLSISPACCDQLVKILITLEPYGVFGSKFEYLCILSSHWYAKRLRGFTGRGILVKMRITLEPHGIHDILIKFCILIHFNIIETQVCKTGLGFAKIFPLFLIVSFKSYDLVAKGTFTDIHNSIDQ